MTSPLPHVEQALAWAAQQGYAFAERAAEEYGNEYARQIYLSDSYWNVYSWRDR